MMMLDSPILPALLPVLTRHRSAPAKAVGMAGEHDAAWQFDVERHSATVTQTCLPSPSASPKSSALIGFESFPAALRIAPCRPSASPRSPGSRSFESSPAAHQGYLQSLLWRSAAHAQQRHLHRVQSERALQLQRAARRFLSVLRWRRKTRAAGLVQRWARGFLQRLDAAGVGRGLLAARRTAHEDKNKSETEAFVAANRNSMHLRAALKGLRAVVPEQQRGEVLKELLELEHRRNMLPGLRAAKNFLVGLRADMLNRIAFGEEVNITPMLLMGPPGSGKRLIAKLVHEELSAMRICKGPFTETQTWTELSAAFESGKDGPVSNCIYVSDMDDKEKVDWQEVVKLTLRALPKVALIFGLNDKDAMAKIQGVFVKTEPVCIALPSLTVDELATITKRSLEQRGYMFSGGLNLEMLQRVITDQWTSSELAHCNAHLAAIMVDRAIQNKNKRQPMHFNQMTNPAVLLPEDFGITEASKLELKAAKVKVMKELDAMPGFQKAKDFLYGVRRRVEFVESGGSPSVLETCMNLVLTGNPGVGKTTFARLLFRLLRAHGVLKRDAFIEMNALELKGEYIGQTAPKVIQAVRSARGGALFLDEAYALFPSSGYRDSFSDEAVHTLLTEIENHRTEVLVILAGYKDKMGHLLAQDAGLARRFPLRLDLPDYTSAELAQIADKVAHERFSFGLEEGLVSQLERHIEEEHRNEIKTQNASLAVGLVEQAVEKMTCRLIEEGFKTQESASTLLAVDFGIRATSAEEERINQEKHKVQQELNAIIGMKEPKEHLRQLQRRIEFVRMGGSPKILDTCMNLVLTGNPGTGKTTFARLLFRVLRAHGVLKKDVFIERNELELKGEYCGQTAPKIREIFEMAIGGCLFLDEAYSLANGDQFSNEAIRMLLTEIENHRTEVLVVLAGYEDKMTDFFKADPGLARRFPHTLKLPDYTAADIARITRSVAENRLEVPFEEGVEEALAAWLLPNMKKLHASKHNGGLAAKLAEAALGRLADRVSVSLFNPVEAPQKHRLTVEDFALQC